MRIQNTITKQSSKVWIGVVAMTDSVSGELLGAVVDRRIGGGSAVSGFQWQWGDAENAIDKWSEMTAERLLSWTTSAARP